MASIIIYRGDEDFHIPAPPRQRSHNLWEEPKRFTTNKVIGQLLQNIKDGVVASIDEGFRWEDDEKTMARYIFGNYGFPKKSFINNKATYFTDEEDWAAYDLSQVAPSTFVLVQDTNPSFAETITDMENEGRLITEPIDKKGTHLPHQTPPIQQQQEANPGTDRMEGLDEMPLPNSPNQK